MFIYRNNTKSSKLKTNFNECKLGCETELYTVRHTRQPVQLHQQLLSFTSEQYFFYADNKTLTVSRCKTACEKQSVNCLLIIMCPAAAAAVFRHFWCLCTKLFYVNKWWNLPGRDLMLAAHETSAPLNGNISGILSGSFILICSYGSVVSWIIVA